MKKKSPRLQLNIRLTPEQNELIKQKLEQTQISKTQLIIDSINNNPIYIIPNLEQTISQIKYLGNKVNELSNKILVSSRVTFSHGRRKRTPSRMKEPFIPQTASRPAERNKPMITVSA